MKSKFNPDDCHNEAEVRSKLIVHCLLPYLGYNPDSWYEEVTIHNIRLDFFVLSKPIISNKQKINLARSLIIETKHPKENLDNHLRKLNIYLHKIAIKYGILTNGRDFRIYQRVNSPGLAKDLLPLPLKLLFKCNGNEIINNIEKIKTLIGKDSLRRDDEKKLKAISTNYPKTTKVVTKKMKIIAVYHNKGGVGKTTTVVNLAAALSKKGKKVLVVDLDSQANTTFATGLVKFEDEFDDYIENANISHVIGFSESYPIQDIKVTSNFCTPTVDIIPSHISLMEKESKLNQLAAINFTLLGKLEEVKDQYDIVLIDTPPSLNLFARIALIAAEYLLIPSDLKPFANQGLINVKNFIKDINATKKVINQQPLKILGVLPCKISTHAKFVQHTLPKQLSKITNKYNLPLFETIIFQREDLAKCSDAVQVVGEIEIPEPRSVLDFKPSSQSTQEFENLSAEVLNKIEAT
ncbi:MAG: AAA family ATPase [Cyanobacteria bacterium P01_A01_bin.83]